MRRSLSPPRGAAACLATLPSLVYVKYNRYDPAPPHDPMIAWLQRRAMQGMLRTLIY